MYLMAGFFLVCLVVVAIVLTNQPILLSIPIAALILIIAYWVERRWGK